MVKQTLLSADESLALSPIRPNLLLEGPAPLVDAVVVALTPQLSCPVATWSGEGPLPDEHRGTLVVPEVQRLDDNQQRQLLRWLADTVGKVQVIAMTSEPLFPMVRRGAFLDVLYYRLNVVRVEVPA